MSTWLNRTRFALVLACIAWGVSGIAVAESFTLFPLPFTSVEPSIITRGPDGNLWFTVTGGHKIGRISTSGEFEIPRSLATPVGITAGPDGAIWFTEARYYLIGRLSTGIPGGAVVPVLSPMVVAIFGLMLCLAALFCLRGT